MIAEPRPPIPLVDRCPEAPLAGHARLPPRQKRRPPRAVLAPLSCPARSGEPLPRLPPPPWRARLRGVTGPCCRAGHLGPAVGPTGRSALPHTCVHPWPCSPVQPIRCAPLRHPRCCTRAHSPTAAAPHLDDAAEQAGLLGGRGLSGARGGGGGARGRSGGRAAGKGAAGALAQQRAQPAQACTVHMACMVKLHHHQSLVLLLLSREQRTRDVRLLPGHGGSGGRRELGHLHQAPSARAVHASRSSCSSEVSAWASGTPLARRSRARTAPDLRCRSPVARRRCRRRRPARACGAEERADEVEIERFDTSLPPRALAARRPQR